MYIIFIAGIFYFKPLMIINFICHIVANVTYSFFYQINIYIYIKYIMLLLIGIMKIYAVSNGKGNRFVLIWYRLAM